MRRGNYYEWVNDPSLVLAALIAGEPIPEREPEPPGVIYCIGGDEGPVKIGWTGKFRYDAAEKRRIQLQIGNWIELRVLGELYGSQDDEKELHLRLMRHRVRGEWFERGAALAEFERFCDELEGRQA